MYDETYFNMKNIIGSPIDLPGIGCLKPLTVEEIILAGIDNYNKYLGLLTISATEIEDILELDLEEEHNIEPFEFLVVNCMQNEEVLNQVLAGLSLFLHATVSFNENGYFEIEGSEDLIYHKNFNFFVDILKKQNCVKEETKILNKALRKHRRISKKAKSKYKSESGDISNIISVVCSLSSCGDFLKVKDFTMFQLINAYRRFMAYENYNVYIQSLIHGASDDKKKKTPHWSEDFED